MSALGAPTATAILLFDRASACACVDQRCRHGWVNCGAHSSLRAVRVKIETAARHFFCQRRGEKPIGGLPAGPRHFWLKSRRRSSPSRDVERHAASDVTASTITRRHARERSLRRLDGIEHAVDVYEGARSHDSGAGAFSAADDSGSMRGPTRLRRASPTAVEVAICASRSASIRHDRPHARTRRDTLAQPSTSTTCQCRTRQSKRFFGA